MRRVMAKAKAKEAVPEAVGTEDEKQKVLDDKKQLKKEQKEQKKEAKRRTGPGKLPSRRKPWGWTRETAW